MLLPRVSEFLVAQHRQRAGDAFAGVVRHDDVVDVTALAGYEGVGKLLAVLLGARGYFFGIANIFAEDNLNRPLGPITAISAFGHAKLTSPRRCLEAITS